MLQRTISTASRALRSTAHLGTAGIQRQFQGAAARTQLFQIPVTASRPLAARTARWYSSEAEAKNGEEAKKEEKKEESKEGSEEVKKEGEEKTESPEEALKKQLEAKEAEVREFKDRWMRAVAEFQNLQTRTQAEVKAAKEFAIQRFAKDLLDTVDNFERALGAVPQEKLQATGDDQNSNKDLISLYEGIKMIETVMLSTFKKHGIERFDPVGEVFNPQEHEATFMAAMPDKEHNTVFHVQSKGFKLNGRVLRAAKVGVVKNK